MPASNSANSGNDSPGSVRRRKSYIEVVPGGPHVLLDPVPWAEEWILVTKDIAYAGMPVFMDTPPMASFLDGTEGASIVPHTHDIGRITSSGSSAWGGEAADLNDPFLPGSVDEDSAGRDQITNDVPTPRSTANSAKGIPEGAKSAISEAEGDGQAAKQLLPLNQGRQQAAPLSEPSSPRPSAAGFSGIISEKRGLKPFANSLSFGSEGGRDSGFGGIGSGADDFRKAAASMKMDHHVHLPVRLICKIVHAVQLPKPSHGTNTDPYCLISVSQSNKKSRTRTLTNTEDPEWDEEFVYNVQDINTSINVEVMHKDVLKDELLGSVSIRCREILDNELNEPWSKEYAMYSRQGQVTSSVLFFQFKLEPVTVDVIRFTSDENEGRLVEPFDNDIIDIWKVRWEGSGEVGWYHCGFNGVHNLRCAVLWSQAVDTFKLQHGGDAKLVRRSQRPGMKEVPEEQYAKLPSYMRVDMKDVRGRSFLKKSLSIGRSAGARRTATLGRNAARRERERSDSEEFGGISTVQRLSIGIGRRLSAMFSAKSPVAAVENPQAVDALFKVPLQPPLRRNSLQPQRVDSLANLNKPRRFSSVDSGSVVAEGDHMSMSRGESVRQLLRENSRSFRNPTGTGQTAAAENAAGKRLPSHYEEGVNLPGNTLSLETGFHEAGRFLSTVSSNDGSAGSPTHQSMPTSLKLPTALAPIAQAGAAPDAADSAPAEGQGHDQARSQAADAETAPMAAARARPEAAAAELPASELEPAAPLKTPVAASVDSVASEASGISAEEGGVQWRGST